MPTIERDSDTPVGTPTAQPAPAQGAKLVQIMSAVTAASVAGFGTRFDPDNPKQLASVGGKPIVCWSIDALEHRDRVSDVVVMVNPKVYGEVETSVGETGYTETRVIVDGGDERVDSIAVTPGALAMVDIPDDTKIPIHNAIHPFVEQSTIDGSIGASDQFTAATVTYASTDIALLTEGPGDLKVVRSVPDRPSTFRAQTP